MSCRSDLQRWPKGLERMNILLACALCHALTSAFALGDVSTGNRRVSVIGGGIGGSSAAYFLRQELGNNIRIDV